MEQEKTRQLAERIALLLLEDEKKADDFSSLRASLRASLEKINERLSRIEEKSAFSNNIHPSSFILNSSKPHSSQEKFAVLEAVADEITGHYQTEKACPYEPTGKPCDHCAMCNSRGF